MDDIKAVVAAQMHLGTGNWHEIFDAFCSANFCSSRSSSGICAIGRKRKTSDSNQTIAPFVFKTGDELSGFSIDLWDLIAQERGWEYEWVYIETLGKMLSEMRESKGDAAIAAVSITAERETVIDFSYPYYQAGLQILVSGRDGGTGGAIWSAIKDLFTSQAFAIAALIFLVSVLVVSHVTWLLERKNNPHFSQSYIPGLWDAFWWAIVTITTVGYGDKAPTGVSGRVFALFWMIFGYFMFAYFTAAVTSTVTVQELRGDIQGPDDLFDKRVAVVANSTSASYLQRRGKTSNVVFVPSIDDAYGLLDDKSIDAIVHDAPVLQYYVTQQDAGDVRIAGDVFNPEAYGVVLPRGSALREEVNQSILRLREDGSYTALIQKWFGG